MEPASLLRGSMLIKRLGAGASAPRIGARAESFLAVAANGRTYRNLSYLLLALPLGLAYFLFLAIGFALGTALALTLVGPPLLLAVAAGSWRLVALERRLLANLLGEPIAAQQADAAGGLTGIWSAVKAASADEAAGVARRRLVARLGDPAAARGLVFLIAKLPLGIVSFATVVATYGLAIALMLAPVTYRFAAPIGAIGIDGFEEAVLAFLIAPLAFLAAMHLSNGLAGVSARFARSMLAPEACRR